MDRTTSSNSVRTQLKKVESVQYPATHLGHLTPDQEAKLEAFKNLAQDKGYYRPATSGHRASHDDETMLRYLRARKFQPREAFVQFKDTEDWRKENHIGRLYDTIEIEDFENTRRLYPQWTGRRDKRGIPVYVFEIAPLNSKAMAAYDKSIASSKMDSGKISPRLIRLFALYENLLQFVMPFCSSIPDRPYAETPVSQSNNIVDIAGVGLKQFWNLKQHMQDASTLATAHYPETLDRIFIIGAPSFFPTVWGWVKNWFDPITVSKIFILSKADMKKTLEQYIDPANLPKKYGGSLDWEWGDGPSLDPVATNALEWEHPSKSRTGEKAFPPGPIRWSKDEEGNMVAVAVGSEHGQQREVRVAKLPVQEDLTLGNITSRLAVQDTLFGEPSTTGTHTHPTDDQEYFPTTGVTPPDEHEEDEALRQGTPPGPEPASVAAAREDPSTKAADFAKGGAAIGGVAAAGATGAVIEGRYDPMKSAYSPSQTSQGSGSQEYRSVDPDVPARVGTSGTKFEAQSATRAEGQLANETADVVDHGYGDKSTTMEPRTVGQAHKEVHLPEATGDEQPAPSYLEQAKSAAAGAAATVTSMGNAALAKVGLAGESEANAHSAEDAEKESKPEKKEDPRVDKMEDKDIEDFIRTKYSTHGK